MHLKKGDRRPPCVALATDGAGTAIDLTGCTAKFFMRLRDSSGTPKVNGAAATVVAPQTQGKVQYDWAAADVDTAGIYEAEFEATFADGRKLSIPNDGFIIVTVLGDLG
jgi:hypothetical protein